MFLTLLNINSFFLITKLLSEKMAKDWNPPLSIWISLTLTEILMSVRVTYLPELPSNESNFKRLYNHFNPNLNVKIRVKMIF